MELPLAAETGFAAAACKADGWQVMRMGLNWRNVASSNAVTTMT